MRAKINNNSIVVPECAIRVPNKKPLSKKNIPRVGQNNEEILKGLGYSKKVISELRKKNIID
jgi:crotonobetainyl-CoA:carnitine CoA-transferase CaiB-like acyl-CoA transferase